MMDSVAQRREAIRSHLDLDQEMVFLVANPADVTWCTGFTGSNSCVVFTRSRTFLVTDGRYTTQAAQECGGLDVVIETGTALRAATDLLREEPVATVLIQAEQVTWADLRHLEHVLPMAELLPVDDPFPVLRAGKSHGEVAVMQRALDITEQAFERILGSLEEGITENQVAAELDYIQRSMGASGPAFDTIVAFSDNAAKPHARPGKRKLQHGDIILMDFGCVLDGYHSDMTRMVAFGKADKEFMGAYVAVQEALDRATLHASSGVQGVVLDGVARDVLTRNGYGDRFTHSLGHGVGLEIHEFPSVSARNPHPLPDGCIITLEPGVYLEGQFGIRIENMVRLQPDGCEVMNTLTTELTIL